MRRFGRARARAGAGPRRRSRSFRPLAAAASAILPLSLLAGVAAVAAVAGPVQSAGAVTVVTPAPMTALILSSTVSTQTSASACSAADTTSSDCTTPAPSCSNVSNEECALVDQGWTVTVVDPSTWDAMTESQFASYQLLVLGDPTCTGTPDSAAESNASTWVPAVDGSTLLVGTDPVFHYGNGVDHAGAGALIWHGLEYAGAQSGKTGLYFDLSCWYESASAGQTDTILNDIESGFQVAGAGCADSIFVVASAGPLVGVTNNDLSDWECSVHEYFNAYPADFVPYALDTVATDADGSPCLTDYGTGQSGCPYIMARGGGVTEGSISLTGPASSLAAGTTTTLTARVGEGTGPPAVGTTVTFTCSSGPCSDGTAPTGSTDSNGDATLDYASTSEGTDVWTASVVMNGQSFVSPSVDVTWTAAATSFTISADPTTTMYGNTVQLQGTGLPAGATGTISFYENGTTTLLCSGDVSEGGASCSTDVLTPGTYTVTASYSGDSGDLGSNSTNTTSFTVTPGSTSTGTAVDDASTGSTWSGKEITGASAFDIATVTPGYADGPTPTGTVVFSLYPDAGCAGSPSSTSDPLPLTDGVAKSPPSGALAGGSHSYQAAYTPADGSPYAGSTGDCEPFTVGPAPTTIGTAVDDASTGTAWSGTEVTGASAFDTSSLAGAITGFVPTGTVQYDLYRGASCSGSTVTVDTETLTGAGAVPASAATFSLPAGSYSFQASYSGDPSYAPATSSCAPFSVLQAPRVLGTVVDDLGSGLPWNNAEVTGANAYDTATITAPLPKPPVTAGRLGSGIAVANAVAGVPSNSVVPSGTVTYSFYGNGTCSGDPTWNGDQVTLTPLGAVPNSRTTGRLAPGAYGFEATYSGDINYFGATGACEPFTVNKASTAEELLVLDGAGHIWGTSPGSEVTGAEAQGSATLPDVQDANVGTPIPGGTVTYSFFDGGTCSGTPTGTSVVTITGATVPETALTSPLASGTYSAQAVYSGDSNYLGSSSACESFTVSKASPVVGTTVDDVATGDPWSGSEATGAAAFDTASFDRGVVVGFTPTGSITYDLYQGSGESVCSEEQHLVSSTTEPLGADGSLPVSPDTDPLGAGNYYFEATYSGDSNYDGFESSCERFTVDQAPVPVSSAVFDVPPGGLEQTGSAAFDTATLTAVTGFVPTGTVTYDFYEDGTCSNPVADGTWPDTVTLTDGTVPASAVTAPLAAGSYSFEATYDGDANYLSDQVGPCETFSVGVATPTVTTQVEDAVTQAAWSGTEIVGASAFDTASVVGVDGFPPGGPVSFALYDNGTCAGSPAQTWPPPDADGTLGSSSGPSGPLAAGAYSFLASYGGDGNYSPATSACEPFAVGRAPSLTSGVVEDAATNTPWSGAEHQGAAAYDRAAVRGLAGVTPTGTLTYAFFRNGTCGGAPASTQTVSLAGGAVPVSASTGGLPPGGLSYLATYGGDSQYLASSSGCQRFAAQATGYRLEGGDGGLFAFHATYTGSVGFPSPPGLGLHIFNFTGMTPARNGYWMVQSNGGIFAFGSAVYYGSLPARHVTVNDIVGIAATPDFKGYWMVSSTGTVYSFGDAHGHGGAHATDIVAILSHDAGGYWLLGADGAVYAFGDAKYHGGCSQAGSGCRGAHDIVGFASADPGGYWLVSRTGGVYGFGDAHYHGSCALAGSGCRGVSDIVGIATPDAAGYWLAGANGAVYHFGDALLFGNEVGTHLVRPIIAIS